VSTITSTGYITATGLFPEDRSPVALGQCFERAKRRSSQLTYEELLRELKAMVAQAQRQVIWFNRAAREKLLVALTAMRDKVSQPGRRVVDPSKPNWEDVCGILGITPDIVRKWKHRTAAETDSRHLLGEEEQQPKPSQEQQNREALKHLERLVTAVLNGEDELAERLAAALAERYGF
jgi:hypothetical protein